MLSVSILGIKEKIKKNIKKLDNLNIDFFHIDIMDGIFVENTTWEYKEIKKIVKHRKTKKDIHLMVKDVKKYIDDFINLKPEIITFHYEATDNHIELINYIKKHNIKAGISIKPNTEVEKIKELLNMVDLVLVMSVEPGKGGQKYIDNSTNKINELYNIRKENNYKYLIEVDGGIYVENVSQLLAAGANVIVSGSGVFKGDIQYNVKRFLDIFGN